MFRNQPGGFPDAGSEHTCSSSASRSNWAKENNVSYSQYIQQGIQKEMKWGSRKTSSKPHLCHPHPIISPKVSRVTSCTEPMKEKFVFLLPVWGWIKCGLSSLNCEYWQTEWGRRHTGRAQSLKVRSQISSISITWKPVRKFTWSALLQTYLSETVEVVPCSLWSYNPSSWFWSTLTAVVC